jgi:hypothetical protein
LRFRRIAGLDRICVGGVGCDVCLVNTTGAGRAFGVVLRHGGVTLEGVLAGVTGEPGLDVNSMLFDLGVPNGFSCISSGFSGSLERNGFSWLSLGRRDSVEPLCFMERVGGRSLSSNRANSICRCAIWLLSLSKLSFHSGIEVDSVLRAWRVDRVVIVNK